jgi:hypothetical protein
MIPKKVTRHWQLQFVSIPEGNLDPPQPLKIPIFISPSCLQNKDIFHVW